MVTSVCKKRKWGGVAGNLDFEESRDQMEISASSKSENIRIL